MIRKPVKDGLGNNVRDYYYDPSSQQIELVTNPPEHVSSSEKVGSPEHKHKFPDRYKAGYVDWWNRDKKEKINNEPLVRQFRNDDPSTFLSNPEQQKGMLLATIEDAKKPKLKPRKKINAYADVKISIPTINYSLLRDPKQEARDAAIEKLRVHAFTKSESDADKGIGSLANTTGRKLRAAAAKDSWEKNREKIYEDK
jgi:hypothetical protein